MRHGDALGAAVALVGDEPVDALCLRYDKTGEQTSHSVESLTFTQLVRRSAASEGCLDHAWYLQWRGLPHPMPAAADIPERTGEAGEVGEADGLVSEDDLLMSLPGEADGELAAAMAADSERAAASGMPSAAAAVPSGLGLGAGRLGADDAGDRADATPPEELRELQPAPVEEDEEVQRATAAGLQAAVVVTPLDNEEL